MGKGDGKRRFMKVVRMVIRDYHQAFIDNCPENPLSYERQGYVYYQLGEYEIAAEKLAMAVKMGTSNGKIWKVQGNVCYVLWKNTLKEKYLQQAMDSYEQGMKFVQVFTNPILVLNLAIVQEKAAQTEMAYNTIVVLLKNFPKFAKRTEVLFRGALIVLFAVTWQEKYVDQERKDKLKEAIDYVKEATTTASVNDATYVSIVYVAARLFEELATSKAKKQSTNYYQEIFNMNRKDKLLQTDYSLPWSNWLDEYTTWQGFSKYFENKREFILAYDAQHRVCARLTDATWKADSFSFEPHATQWYCLADMASRCKLNDSALQSAEKAIEYSPYYPALRDTLALLNPTKWSIVFQKQNVAQTIIAKVYRGNRARDNLHCEIRRQVKVATDMYHKNPYHAPSRRILGLHEKRIYATLFVSQYLAAATIQKAVHDFLAIATKRREAARLHQEKIDNVQWKLNRRSYNQDLRNQLIALSPQDYLVPFQGEDKACIVIQSFVRGVQTRYHYQTVYKPNAIAKRQHHELKAKSALILQYAFQSHINHHKLQRRLFIRLTQKKIAINIQKLYRARQKRRSKVRTRRRGVAGGNNQTERHNAAARKIQRAQLRLMQYKEWNRTNEEKKARALRLRERKAAIIVSFDHHSPAIKIQKCFRRYRFSQKLRKYCRSSVKDSRIDEMIQTYSREDPTVSWVDDAMWENSQKLRAALQNHTVVIEKDPPMTCKNAIILGKEMYGAVQVNTLIIASGYLGATGLRYVIRGLRLNQGISCIAIGSNFIDSDELSCCVLKELADLLLGAKFHLRSLIIESNKIEDPGAIALVKSVGDYFLSRYGRLECLSLTQCLIGDPTCYYLGQTIEVNRTLLEIDFSGNKIQCEGAIRIAAGLKCNHTLQKLNLSYNIIGTLGARKLFVAIENNRSLKELNLACNIIQADILPRICQLAESQTGLQELGLLGNKIAQDLTVKHIAFFQRKQEHSAISSLSPKKQLPKRWQTRRDAHVAGPNIRPGKNLKHKNCTTQAILRPYRRRLRDASLTGISSASAVLRSPEYLRDHLTHVAYTHGTM